MRITLTSVEATIDGKTESRTIPLARLFELAAATRHVRLIYLTRASQADHDMAVIAGRTSGTVDELTRRIEADPSSACTATPGCAWIPAGIAVVAQAKVYVDGQDVWIPANGRLRDAVAPNTTPRILRQWNGRALPVAGASADLLALPVAHGDVIRTR
jgi:hypothetical protein